jgi:hypothetical protein
LLQRLLFHHDKENRREDQYVNRRGNHAADDRHGDRLHHVGVNAGFLEDRDQAGEIELYFPGKNKPIFVVSCLLSVGICDSEALLFKGQ